ncbi:hypothetical protein BTM25_04300 [Actinomadura rubteroloni]|uniref:Uncharacterized protein n=1 Tax=Actinomadura rubteroloni TaxID=1926885 RepID=A0A2P4ULW9_9ACTN|nr:hypothetical protein [Actinomadura rubteroloni]POM26046.1 hypothetical protein BTM25_04300 [Actinomadura rubteroloni]
MPGRTATVDELPSAASTVHEHPRALVPRHIMEHLITRAVRRGHDRSAALRLIDITLVFLVACAENPEARLSPVSDASDEIWHDLITHTTFYPDFCRALGRKFIHHVPTINEDIMSGRAHARTIAAMQRTGLPVDEELLITSPRCMNTCNHPCHDSDDDESDDEDK